MLVPPTPVTPPRSLSSLWRKIRHLIIVWYVLLHRFHKEVRKTEGVSATANIVSEEEKLLK